MFGELTGSVGRMSLVTRMLVYDRDHIGADVHQPPNVKSSSVAKPGPRSKGWAFGKSTPSHTGLSQRCEGTGTVRALVRRYGS